MSDLKLSNSCSGDWCSNMMFIFAGPNKDQLLTTLTLTFWLEVILCLVWAECVKVYVAKNIYFSLCWKTLIGLYLWSVFRIWTSMSVCDCWSRRAVSVRVFLTMFNDAEEGILSLKTNTCMSQYWCASVGLVHYRKNFPTSSVCTVRAKAGLSLTTPRQKWATGADQLIAYRALDCQLLQLQSWPSLKSAVTSENPHICKGCCTSREQYKLCTAPQSLTSWVCKSAGSVGIYSSI